MQIKEKVDACVIAKEVTFSANDMMAIGMMVTMLEQLSSELYDHVEMLNTPYDQRNKELMSKDRMKDLADRINTTLIFLRKIGVDMPISNVFD